MQSSGFVVSNRRVSSRVFFLSVTDDDSEEDTMQTYRNQRKSERKPRLFRSLAIQLLVYALMIFPTPPFLSAAVFHVPAGDVTGLIAAITAANSNGEENTINLAPGTYSLTAGLLSVTSIQTIKGLEPPRPSLNGTRCSFFPYISGRILRDAYTRWTHNPRGRRGDP